MPPQEIRKPELESQPIQPTQPEAVISNPEIKPSVVPSETEILPKEPAAVEAVVSPPVPLENTEKDPNLSLEASDSSVENTLKEPLLVYRKAQDQIEQGDPFSAVLTRNKAQAELFPETQNE